MSQAQKTNLYSTQEHQSSSIALSSQDTTTAPDEQPAYSSIRLMELPPSLLSLIESSDPPKCLPFVESHVRLTIKSSPNGIAILNAPTKSYLLRTVDQSNSLMLFAPSERDGFGLIHTAKQYLELISNPNRAKLDALLPEWDGETVTKSIPLITMSELRRKVAASDLEIDAALIDVFAVEIDGDSYSLLTLTDLAYVYRMASAYVTQLLDLILPTAITEALNLERLLAHDIITSPPLDEEKPECVEAILSQFSKRPIELNSLLVPVYNLDHTKIARWYGLRTLSSLNRPIRVTQFLEAWQSAIPAAIDKATPDMNLLIGNFHHPSLGMVQYLPCSELSPAPEQRVGQLFQVKEKWHIDEIMPFLQGCVENGEGWEKRAQRECQKWARIKGEIVMRR